MAFKMKRSGMQLRSTTRVAPQLTQYQSSNPSPILQSEIASVDAVYGGGDELLPKKPSDNRVEPGSEEEAFYIKNKNRCDKLTNEQKLDPKNKCTGFAQEVAPGGGGEVSASENLQVNEDGTSMRPLTNREVRMNQRMVDSSSRRMQNDLDNANRRIRKAIRKGMPPLESDLKMVSGESMGGLDPNFNPYAHTSGSKSIYTGVHRGAQNFESGGVNMNFNDEVQAAADKSMLAKGFEKNDEGKYFDPKNPKKVIEQSLVDGVMKDAKASVNTDRGERGSYTVKDGQYLNNKTKKKLRKSGYKEGDKFGSGTLSSLEDTSARTRRLQKKAKNADGKKKERLNKRIKRRGGSPVAMSIQLTRPSYKQKGFGK